MWVLIIMLMNGVDGGVSIESVADFRIEAECKDAVRAVETKTQLRRSRQYLSVYCIRRSK